MTISKSISIILLLLIVALVDTAAAMTVYMNDASEIEAQSARKEGEIVYVCIGPDHCLDFPASEVNLRKSGIRDVRQERTQGVERGVMASAPARSGDKVDELIEIAGIRSLMSDIFGRGGRGEIEQLFADTYSPAQAESTFKRSLGRKLDNRDLAVVLAWYKSPVGAKIAEAESVLDFNLYEKAAAYAGRDTVPGYRERMNLVAQIVQVSGSSEIGTRLTQNMMRNMIKSIPPDYPNAQAIKKRIQDEIPSLEQNRKRIVQYCAYNYRDLSIRELHDYLNFLRSATGKKYMTAVRAATEEIFKKVTINIEKYFRSYVRR